jgi:hypothetical protein
MKRGQLTMQLDLPASLPLTQKRTRNCFQGKRNEDMLIRYYYYSVYHKFRYEYCIQLLEKEFYLTGITIAELLVKNLNAFNRLADQDPSIEDMRKNCPHFLFKTSLL